MSDIRKFITIVEGNITGPHMTEDGAFGTYVIKGAEAPALANILGAEEGGAIVKVGAGFACLRRGKLYVSKRLNTVDGIPQNDA